MRDPDRIPKVLKAVEDLWRRDPDLRLGQLLVNATKYSGRHVVCPEVFSLEDEALLVGLERYATSLSQRKDPSA